MPSLRLMKPMNLITAALLAMTGKGRDYGRKHTRWACSAAACCGGIAHPQHAAAPQDVFGSPCSDYPSRMLVSGRDLLLRAVAEGRAIGSFNTYNLEISRAILRAAEARSAPVFLAIGTGA